MSTLLAACTGGSPKKGTGGAVTCGDQGSFCLVSCNLGCTLTGGCAITDIAQNQPLVFNFSREIDPRSVDLTSFSLKTTTGEEPVGQFVVEGQTISFVPDVRFVQGQTFFGFSPNLEYVLSLPGGVTAANGILSTSGQRLLHDYSCTLRVTLGVIDLDQRPPSAELVSPSASFGVQRNAPVVIEFSELVDFAPFANAAANGEPVQYFVRRSLPSGGVLVCDTNSDRFQLSGSPRLVNDIVRGRTIATFTPRETLPSGACVEVAITSGVKDLSGRTATTQVFHYTLVEEAATELHKLFDFADDTYLDTDRSSGTWANNTGVFTTLGGDGRHGDFTPADGQRVTDTYWIWDTDNQLITAKPTATIESDETVTDGNFYFTTFDVPAGYTIEFRGSKPVHIHVRGRCHIEGRLLAAGKAATGTFNVKAPTGWPGGPWQGGPGAVGGPGGGRGGDGAWGCDGTGNVNDPGHNNLNGYSGEDLRMPPGHPLTANAVGTGGRGGLLHPAAGNQTLLTFPGFSVFCCDVSAGGSGGGLITAGADSLAFHNGQVSGQPAINNNPALLGQPVTGGPAIALLNLPATFNSSEYFLIGGSGGGGGGGHPLFAQTSSSAEPYKFRSGSGGGGGGGVVRVRVGGRFEMLAGSTVDVSGGDGLQLSFATSTPLAPGLGGGGSGGTALIQLAGGSDFSGAIDVSGGAGGRYVYSAGSTYKADSLAGNGGDGFLRVEVPGTALSLARLGTVLPAPVPASSGVLAEHDDATGFQSVFVSTGAVFPPTYVRYVIHATVGANQVVYSDDPAEGIPAAPGAALVFWVQGADVNLQGELTGTRPPRPWRNQVGSFITTQGSLNRDSTVGFRWALLQDRTQATTVVVHDVRIDYRI
ncbi:MAG: Ig-like domain-containing protein [Planctomycetota bacterium]